MGTREVLARMKLLREKKGFRKKIDSRFTSFWRRTGGKREKSSCSKTSKQEEGPKAAGENQWAYTHTKHKSSRLKLRAFHEDSSKRSPLHYCELPRYRSREYLCQRQDDAQARKGERKKKHTKPKKKKKKKKKKKQTQKKKKKENKKKKKKNETIESKPRAECKAAKLI